MKKLTLLLHAFLAVGLILSGTVAAFGKPSPKSQKLTAEIVSVDPMTKSITIKNEKGESQTLTATKKAATYIRNLTPGAKAVLTCTWNAQGEIQSVTNFKIIKK